MTSAPLKFREPRLRIPRYDPQVMLNSSRLFDACPICSCKDDQATYLISPAASRLFDNILRPSEHSFQGRLERNVSEASQSPKPIAIRVKIRFFNPAGTTHSGRRLRHVTSQCYRREGRRRVARGSRMPRGMRGGIITNTWGGVKLPGGSDCASRFGGGCCGEDHLKRHSARAGAVNEAKAAAPGRTARAARLRCPAGLSSGSAVAGSEWEDMEWV